MNVENVKGCEETGATETTETNSKQLYPSEASSLVCEVAPLHPSGSTVATAGERATNTMAGSTNQLLVKNNNEIFLKHKRRYCRIEGCNSIVKSQGLCQRHGAKPKICKVEGCTKQAQGNFDKMCKAHFKAMKRKTTPIPKVKNTGTPPPAEGFSVYDDILPRSLNFVNDYEEENSFDQTQNDSTAPKKPLDTRKLPLIVHLKHGFDTLKPPAWHRNEERRARGMFPIDNPAAQLEGWERELVWMEILVLTGVPGASFRHLARAWGRDKGFHMVLAQFICERHGNVERKKRIKEKHKNATNDKEYEGELDDGDETKKKRRRSVSKRPIDTKRKGLIVASGPENGSYRSNEDVGADVWDPSLYGDVDTNEALAAEIFDFTEKEFERVVSRYKQGGSKSSFGSNASRSTSTTGRSISLFSATTDIEVQAAMAAILGEQQHQQTSSILMNASHTRFSNEGRHGSVMSEYVHENSSSTPSSASLKIQHLQTAVSQPSDVDHTSNQTNSNVNFKPTAVQTIAALKNISDLQRNFDEQPTPLSEMMVAAPQPRVMVTRPSNAFELEPGKRATLGSTTETSTQRLQAVSHMMVDQQQTNRTMHLQTTGTGQSREQLHGGAISIAPQIPRHSLPSSNMCAHAPTPNLPALSQKVATARTCANTPTEQSINSSTEQTKTLASTTKNTQLPNQFNTQLPLQLMDRAQVDAQLQAQSQVIAQHMSTATIPVSHQNQLQQPKLFSQEVSYTLSPQQTAPQVRSVVTMPYTNQFVQAEPSHIQPFQEQLQIQRTNHGSHSERNHVQLPSSTLVNEQYGHEKQKFMEVTTNSHVQQADKVLGHETVSPSFPQAEQCGQQLLYTQTTHPSEIMVARQTPPKPVQLQQHHRSLSFQRHDQQLQVQTRVTAIGETSAGFKQQMVQHSRLPNQQHEQNPNLNEQSVQDPLEIHTEMHAKQSDTLE